MFHLRRGRLTLDKEIGRGTIAGCSGNLGCEQEPAKSHRVIDAMALNVHTMTVLQNELGVFLFLLFNTRLLNYL